jgi:hypothetical protein
LTNSFYYLCRYILCDQVALAPAADSEEAAPTDGADSGHAENSVVTGKGDCAVVSKSMKKKLRKRLREEAVSASASAEAGAGAKKARHGDEAYLSQGNSLSPTTNTNSATARTIDTTATTTATTTTTTNVSVALPVFAIKSGLYSRITHKAATV